MKQENEVMKQEEEVMKQEKEGMKQKEKKTFFWRELKEINPVWNEKDPQAQEKIKKPFEVAQRLIDGEVNRREFLTVMGASAAMATFACARKPVHKIIPYVIQPKSVVPGKATWYASTCGGCAQRCGLLVKTREGRPIKLEGNPDHPLNEGRLCARGQAHLLDLYDPDRLKAPVQKVNQQWNTLSWDQADQEIAKKLASFQKKGKVIVVTPYGVGPTTEKLIQEFLSGFSQSQHIQWSPLERESEKQAQALCYGSRTLPTYRWDEAQLVVSFGADFLGTWGKSLLHSRAWIQKRKVRHQKPSRASMSKLYMLEPVWSTTGAQADVRIPILPEDALWIVCALLHELIVVQKKSRFAHENKVLSLLKGFSIHEVSKKLHLEHEIEKKLKHLASLLWEHRGRSLVLSGGPSVQTQHAVELHVAVSFLNEVLGNEGKTILRGMHSGASVGNLQDFMKALDSVPSVVIFYRVNPQYVFSKMLSLKEKLAQVPLVVSVQDRIDETALLAQYVLPTHHPLENWGDAHPQKGIWSLQQPVVAPLFQTRSFQDMLLNWIKKGNLKIRSSFLKKYAKQTFPDWHAYLKQFWKKQMHRKSAFRKEPFEYFWKKALQKGILLSQEPAKAHARFFKINVLKGLEQKKSFFKTKHPFDLSFAAFETVMVGDGSFANNSWLQELPDPITSLTWDNAFLISPRLARRWRVKSNDVVRVRFETGSVDLPVLVQPGLPFQVVVAALGYGREAAGKVGSGVGKNIYSLSSRDSRGGQVFSGQKVLSFKKLGRRYELAVTQRSFSRQHRPVINDISLKQFQKNPKAQLHTDPHLRLKKLPTLWKKYPYDGPYRWAMVVDLTTCIGCQACVIACQSENNILTVGRDQVRRGRVMHWIRLDRYYRGNEDRVDIVFQPMLCQQCENAPCETVCPVLATVHNDEGLNEQVYSRCVGTRYCQNNCPYEARKFNYYDYWKKYSKPQYFVWNPDVTVRTRGVIEKCTFCLQRIEAGKQKAKQKGRLVRDGEFQTACQQTCPTDAIVFGNIHDPQSEVTRLKNRPEAFRVLEYLNTKPSVSYLSRIRNKFMEEEGEHHE